MTDTLSGQYPTDSNGIRIRLGRDPQMRMEGETSDAGTSSNSFADANRAAEASLNTGSTADPTSTDSSEDFGDLDFSDLDSGGQETTTTDDDLSDLDALFQDDKIQSFDRKYVERLRAADASKRQALKTYKDTFSKFDDDSANRLLGLMDELATNPSSAAGKLIQLGNIMLGNETVENEGKPVEGETTTTEDELDKPMTRREWQAEQDRVRQEREQTETQVKQQQAVDNVLKEAQGLGYELNTPMMHTYLGLLAGKAAGDANVAHQMTQDFKRSMIKDYIDEKKKQVPTTKGTLGNSQSAELEAHSPKSMKEATAAAMAHLKSRAGQ